jgi:hypothetical protein
VSDLGDGSSSLSCSVSCSEVVPRRFFLVARGVEIGLGVGSYSSVSIFTMIRVSLLLDSVSRIVMCDRASGLLTH